MAGQEGEWNQVKRKGGRLRNIPAPKTHTADPLPDDADRPNPNPELSVDELLKYHATVTKDWQKAEWWEEVRQVLESASSKPNCPVITKALCLGPGPYEPHDGSSTARRTAHMQTAAFCFIVDHLKTRSGQGIECFIQEPRFTNTDRDFCARLGLQAVDSPDGFSVVDENTLLFGIHIELDVYNQALVKLPGIFIGARLDDWERVIYGNVDTEDSLTAFKEMEASYDKYAFPDIEYMFCSVGIYWRRDEI